MLRCALTRLGGTRRGLATLPLVRDYIKDSLYHPEKGYFCTSSAPVVLSGPPLDFPSMRGQKDYLEALRELYDQGPSTAWGTPAEIFKPWYGRAIARYLLARNEPLNVMEIGGGTGVAAVSILDYIADSYPDVYRNMTYTLVEISPVLAEQQKKRLEHHATVSKVHLGSFLDWSVDITKPTTIIALEVLDNMPHDRIVIEPDHTAWQTHINKSSDVLLPLTDEIAQSALLFANEGDPFEDHGKTWLQRMVRGLVDCAAEAEDVRWVPSGTVMMLDVIQKWFKHPSLLVADFSELKTSIYGARAPLVQTRRGPKDLEMHSYIVPRGSCDIFFPTDFAALSAACQRIGGHDVNVYSHASWFLQWGKQDMHEWTTQSGYQPLAEDYVNMKVLTMN